MVFVTLNRRARHDLARTRERRPEMYGSVCELESLTASSFRRTV
jgi:hypothetical protein